MTTHESDHWKTTELVEHPSTPSLHKAAVVLSLKYLRKVVYAIILQQVMKNRHIGKSEQK